MSKFEVELKIIGVMHVEADSPEQAKRNVELMVPSMQGVYMVNRKIDAEIIKKIDDVELSPDNVIQSQIPTRVN